MQRCHTDDLLLYLYNEVTKEQRGDIEEELGANWPLREKLTALQESADILDQIKIHRPRKQTVDAILEYAEQGLVVRN